MRTKTLLAAAAMLAAGLASSMAQSNVYSLNVVGYVNKVIIGGGVRYTAVANPLNTTNNTLAGILGGLNAGLPSGSQVLIWSPGQPLYTPHNKVPFGSGWSGTSATASFAPGQGALVILPAIQTADITNTFVGEVLQGNLTNSWLAGYQTAGNMVPDSGPVSSMQLTNLPTSGVTLLKWNSAGGTVGLWSGFNRQPFGVGWNPSVPTLEPAEGFLMNLSAPFNWVRNFTVQ